MLFPRKKCPICNGIKFNNFFLQKNKKLEDKLIYVECKNCEFVFKNPANKFNNKNFYLQKIYFSSIKFEKSLLNRFKDIEKIINNYFNISKNISIFDFGCGNGSFIKFLKIKGYKNILGFDFNISLPNKRKLFSNNLNNIKKKFDVITMNHVLEHINNPVNTIKIIKKKFLKKNGIIICEVPSLDQIDDANLKPSAFVKEHFSQFTMKSLYNVFTKSNLCVDKIESIDAKKMKRDPFMPCLIIVVSNNNKYLNLNNLKKKMLIKKLQRIKQLKKFKKFKISVVGCGDGLDYLVNELKLNKIKNLYDNNSFLIGKKKYGVEIKPLKEIKKNKDDHLIISPVNIKNVNVLNNQLKKIIKSPKIINLNP